MKADTHNRKNDFSGFIEALVRRFETHSQIPLQINTLAAETGIEKRRLYDLVNVLVACGICAKTDSHTYCWLGLAAFRSAAKRIAKEVETRAIRHDIQNLFLVQDSPPIGILTSTFIGLSLYLGPTEINICEAALLISRDNTRSKPIRRRLYLVAFLLERLGLLLHTETIGGYEFAMDLAIVATEALSEVATEEELPPTSIAAHLNRIEESFVRRLQKIRREECAGIIRRRTAQIDEVPELMTEIQFQRLVSAQIAH
jgi:hypothetical protein